MLKFHRLFSPRIFTKLVLTLSVGVISFAARSVHGASFAEPTVPQTSGVNVPGFPIEEIDFDRIRDTGFTYVRRGLVWSSIEKTKGQYDFAEADRWIKAAEDRGLGFLCILAFGNKLYEPDQHEMGVRTPEGREGFANYAAAMAERYKDKNVIFEIWNESNSSFWKPAPNADQYMDMLAAAVPKMRQANPKCIITAPSLYHIGWKKAQGFLETCLKRGIHKLVDGISFHAYGDPGRNAEVERNIGWVKEIRALMESNGAPKDFPIIQSEYGINVESKEFSGTHEEKEVQQAQTVIRNYLITLLLKMPLNIHYEWRARAADSKGGSKGLVGRDGKTGTAALKAFQVVMATLKGYRFEDRLTGTAETDFVLVFKNAENKHMLAVWTTKTEHEIEVPVSGATSLSVRDLLGQESTLAVKEGKLSITLKNAPQYIQLDSAKLTK